jgi:hypothetical protein
MATGRSVPPWRPGSDRCRHTQQVAGRSIGARPLRACSGAGWRRGWRGGGEPPGRVPRGSTSGCRPRRRGAAPSRATSRRQVFPTGNVAGPSRRRPSGHKCLSGSTTQGTSSHVFAGAAWPGERAARAQWRRKAGAGGVAGGCLGERRALPDAGAAWPAHTRGRRGRGEGPDAGAGGSPEFTSWPSCVLERWRARGAYWQEVGWTSWGVDRPTKARGLAPGRFPRPAGQ